VYAQITSGSPNVELISFFISCFWEFKRQGKFAFTNDRFYWV